MGKTTIEWATAVWNPTTGCTKVSAGCKNCYAERVAAMFWKDRKFTDVQTHLDRINEPLHWRKPQRIFVDSMSDLFHPSVPFDFILRVWITMARCPQHVFLILTKRPERMRRFVTEWLPAAFALATLTRVLTEPLPNVWLGVSVENQDAADERIPWLLNTPAAIRFASCEPLLGPVDLYHIKVPDSVDDRCLHFSAITAQHDDCFYTAESQLDWLICGGESGPDARPMHINWARSLRDQCQAAGVKYFFKQWGQWLPVKRPGGVAVPRLYCWPDGNFSQRMGKSAAGRSLDGRTWDEIPQNTADEA